jgi:hypothetical protein
MQQHMHMQQQMMQQGYGYGGQMQAQTLQQQQQQQQQLRQQQEFQYRQAVHAEAQQVTMEQLEREHSDLREKLGMPLSPAQTYELHVRLDVVMRVLYLRKAHLQHALDAAPAANEDEADRTALPKEPVVKLIAEVLKIPKDAASSVYEPIVPDCVKACAGVFVTDLVRSAQAIRTETDAGRGPLQLRHVLEAARRRTASADGFPWDDQRFSSVRYE